VVHDNNAISRGLLNGVHGDETQGGLAQPGVASDVDDQAAAKIKGSIVVDREHRMGSAGVGERRRIGDNNGPEGISTSKPGRHDQANSSHPEKTLHSRSEQESPKETIIVAGIGDVWEQSRPAGAEFEPSGEFRLIVFSIAPRRKPQLS
jgi:hypothetical protein